MDFRHYSVMPDEVVRFLSPKAGGVYVDGTIGGGGHSRLILEASSPDGVVYGFDRDEEALRAVAERLGGYAGRLRLLRKNFAELEESLAEFEIDRIDGFLLDLGVSSHQLDRGARGFSFQQDAPLDMRMDFSTGVTAEYLVNNLPEKELAGIIRDFGEERWAVRIAKRIVEARRLFPLKTTLQLVDIIKGSIPRAKWEDRLHPATRTFQALRIAVNDELESLEKGLVSGINMLARGGRIVVISFHSLEDRIVKNTFREFAKGCICPKSAPLCVCGKVPQLKIITPRPVLPRNEEIMANPRSRSAKLRVAEKL
ncbi:MAG TPA: 16S rRNA (cytosine(1402)-N(4))-methyltransferase RsmH [Geobacteraceae bacterium]|nr:16S rRNA (cytosine(1402)-N(4))-methyltransferase RsmH [Geobacteraceae bacterium]